MADAHVTGVARRTCRQRPRRQAELEEPPAQHRAADHQVAVRPGRQRTHLLGDDVPHQGGVRPHGLERPGVDDLRDVPPDAGELGLDRGAVRVGIGVRPVVLHELVRHPALEERAGRPQHVVHVLVQLGVDPVPGDVSVHALEEPVERDAAVQHDGTHGGQPATSRRRSGGSSLSTSAARSTAARSTSRCSDQPDPAGAHLADQHALGLRGLGDAPARRRRPAPPCWSRRTTGRRRAAWPAAGRARGPRPSRVDVVVERVAAGGGEHADLAHAAAEPLAPEPGGRDPLGRGDQHRADRRRRAPWRSRPTRCRPAGRRSTASTPEATRGVPDPGAVEVHGDAGLARPVPAASAARRAAGPARRRGCACSPPRSRRWRSGASRSSAAPARSAASASSRPPAETTVRVEMPKIAAAAPIS